MSPTAHTLLHWWNQMAHIYDRYGVPDRHNAGRLWRTPEWLRMREIQDRLLAQIEDQTGAEQGVVLEKLCDVVGEQGDRAMSLDIAGAEAITAEVMRRAVAAHVREVSLRGMLN